MYSSPSRTARVRSDARSEPADGSENPWHQTVSPFRMRWRWYARCSSVPSAMRVGPACMTPTKFTLMYGASARAYSSRYTSCCVTGRPCPPYSFGQLTPAYPASCSLRCHSVS